MFINDLRKHYIYERNNKLDNLKYYFDEHHVGLMKNRNSDIKFSMAPNELTFTMTQFNTNKSLKNVFGNHLKVIKERMDLFSNNPEWYFNVWLWMAIKIWFLRANSQKQINSLIYSLTLK